MYLFNFKKITLLFSLIFLIIACGKDPDEAANDDLNGTWNITSFTNDGNENILTVYNSGTILFTKNNDTNITGSVVFTLINLNGEPDSEMYAYSIGGEGTILTLIEGDSIDIVNYSLDLNDNNLTMSSNVEDELLIVMATKQ